MSNLKCTFYDSVELDDIDFSDSRAKFYLIDVADKEGKNPGFKLCASVQDLSQLQFDPETRKKHYWLITREQLKKVNQDDLFPEPGDVPSHKKIRSQIFKTVKDVNDFFQFDIPFDPLTTERRYFGSTAQQSHQYRNSVQQLRQQVYQVPINPDIRNLINQGFITEQEYTTTFTDVVRMNFAYTQHLIVNQRLTVEAAKQLTNAQAKTLGERQIITLIEQGKLSIDEAKALSDNQCTRLYFTQPLISVGALTVQSALQLQDENGQIISLKNPGIVALIQQELLTVSQVMNLSADDTYNYDRTQPFISVGKLTFDEAKRLTFDEVQNLKIPVVRDLILNDRLTVNQAKQLTEQQVSSIEAGHIDEVLQQLPPDTPEPDYSAGSGCRIM